MSDKTVGTKISIANGRVMFQVRRTSRAHNRGSMNTWSFSRIVGMEIYFLLLGVTGDPLGHCYEVTKTLRRLERCSVVSEIFKCVHIVINIAQLKLRSMSHRNGTCEEIRELNDCLKDC